MTQNKAQKEQMLQALENGQNISFGYGAKVTLPKQKPVSRVRRKKPVVKPEISEKSCKIASISVLLNMDNLNKKDVRELGKILKSERHHLKLYDVDIQGKSGIAKAHVYAVMGKKTVTISQVREIENVNPLLSKENAQMEMASPTKVAKLQNKLPKWMRSSHSSSRKGMRKRQKVTESIENKLAVFLKNNGESKDKDPP